MPTPASVCIQPADRCSPCSENSFTQEDGCKYTGRHLTEISDTSWDECVAECFRNLMCKVAMFNKKTNTCKLKQWKGTKTCENNNWVSGVRCEEDSKCKIANTFIGTEFDS